MNKDFISIADDIQSVTSPPLKIMDNKGVTQQFSAIQDKLNSATNKKVDDTMDELRETK